MEGEMKILPEERLPDGADLSPVPVKGSEVEKHSEVGHDAAQRQEIVPHSDCGQCASGRQLEQPVGHLERPPLRSLLLGHG